MLKVLALELSIVSVVATVALLAAGKLMLGVSMPLLSAAPDGLLVGALVVEPHVSRGA